jgi:hypothetical protein
MSITHATHRRNSPQCLSTLARPCASFLCTLLCAAAVSACRAAAPPPSSAGAATVAAPSPPPDGTSFSATLSCPIPGKGSQTQATAVAWRVGPPPPAPCVGEACRTLIMTQEQCTWDGFSINGQAVTMSLMHGQGYVDGAGGSATGYDWGTLANGDAYLSRWTETLAPTGITGTWTIVLGTGTLQGLSGKATITCTPPGQTDTIEVCRVAGTYTLAR